MNCEAKTLTEEIANGLIVEGSNDTRRRRSDSPDAERMSVTTGRKLFVLATNTDYDARQ